MIPAPTGWRWRWGTGWAVMQWMQCGTCSTAPCAAQRIQQAVPAQSVAGRPADILKCHRHKTSVKGDSEDSFSFSHILSFSFLKKKERKKEKAPHAFSNRRWKKEYFLNLHLLLRVMCLFITEGVIWVSWNGKRSFTCGDCQLERRKHMFVFKKSSARR